MHYREGAAGPEKEGEGGPPEAGAKKKVMKPRPKLTLDLLKVTRMAL